MMIGHTRRNGCVVLAVAGALDGDGAGQLRLAVTKALADQPRAVICDLAQLVRGTTGLNIFLVIADMMSGWPETAIAIACSDRQLVERLSRLLVDSQIPIHDSVDQAIADLGRQPMIMTDLFHLIPDNDTAGLARHFVADACRHWDASIFAPDALIAVSELVNNAVQHGDGEPIDVRVSLSRMGLRLSVRDNSLSSPEAIHGSGQITGIRVVARLSRSWGVLPTVSGGKIVWCLLSHPDDAHNGGTPSMPSRHRLVSR